MATRASPSTSLDLQKLIGGAARLEIKLINAGLEAMQVYLNQASRLSSLTSETLQAIQDDKATLPDAARKFSDFGRQNVKAFAELSNKLGTAYYDELERLADGALKSGGDKGGGDKPDQPGTPDPAKPVKTPRRARR